MGVNAPGFPPRFFSSFFSATSGRIASIQAGDMAKAMAGALKGLPTVSKAHALNAAGGIQHDLPFFHGEVCA